MKFQKSFPCETNNFVDKMCAYKKVSVTELLYHRGQNDVLLIQLFEGETLKLLFQQYQVFVIRTVSPLPYNKHQRITKGQPKKDIPEKLVTQGSQDEER